MKAILDTNVIISAIFFGGKPLQILRAWKNGKITLIISQEILEEYLGIAAGLEQRYPNVEATGKIKAIAANSELTVSLRLPEQICEDKDDDIFLSAALASKTKIIVSGDKLLKKVSGWRGIRVISPASFVSEFLGK